MKEIHIITRCSRPENLSKIEKSIFNTDLFKITWHICIDLSKATNRHEEFLSALEDLNHKDPDMIVSSYKCLDGEFGHMMINKTLDKIESGFIYVLDDDNIIHPDFYDGISEQILKHQEKSVFVFNQKIGGIDFTNLDIRKALPENIRVGGVDMAQFIIDRGIIGDNRFENPGYIADGTFISKLYGLYPDGFMFIDKILCYYNYLQKAPSFLPKVLLIGLDDTIKIESKFIADFEDVRLNTLCIKDDSKIESVLVDFNPDSIITIGPSFENFPNLSVQPLDIRSRWLHFASMSPEIGEAAYQCASNYILNLNNKSNNPLISFFTPIYNTGDKLNRTYESVKNQEYSNWEWVIVNDSTDDGTTLQIAEKISNEDPRVKVFDFKKKSGGIVGESKYRAASLCSGEYLMELDHDDYITKDAGRLMVEAFKTHTDCKFVYSDCAEIDSNKKSLTYGEGFSFGYGSYRDEFYDGVLYKAVNQPNINPISLRHIVGVPNHFRAWERTFYHSIGGHNRRLSIADDYELIIRTFLNTKMCRIPKLLYLQYFHGSNAQDASRKDIQRRVRTIAHHYNEQIYSRFTELGLDDYVYKTDKNNPWNVPSRFGSDEQPANYIFKLPNNSEISIELEREFTI